MALAGNEHLKKDAQKVVDDDGREIVVVSSAGGGGPVTIADGADVALGAKADVEAAGNGSLIAIVKRLRTLLNGGLPAALGANGGLKVDQAATWPVDTELPAAAALTDTDANPTVPGVGAYGMLWDSSVSQWKRLKSAAGLGDGGGGNTLLGIAEFRLQSANWSRVRGVDVFKPFASTAVTAGTGITIWTPAAGKKFRLMGWMISLSVAGQLIFGDNAVGTVIARSEAVAAAGVSREDGGMGNGASSVAANNVLKLDVSATGNVAGMVWGTEE